MNEKENLTWRDLLRAETEKPYYKNLMAFVKTERNSGVRIFPKDDEVFRALNACPFSELKVVVLGQDPYPTFGHAHGLSFSVNESVRPLPRSLVNIYNELNTDLGIPVSNNGDLNRWASQGVLLLNSVLTVREGNPNSHAGKGWEQFTDKVIEAVNEHKKHVVYLLWGRNAHLKAMNVNHPNNLVIKSSHPSPLGYTKSGRDFIAFQGSRPFSKANDYLSQHGEKPIQW